MFDIQSDDTVTSFSAGGPDGNWRVIAGSPYYYLANRPVYDALAAMLGVILRPLWHIKHGRTSVGVKLLPRVLAAIPASLWRWSRGDC